MSLQFVIRPSKRLAAALLLIQAIVLYVIISLNITTTLKILLLFGLLVYSTLQLRHWLRQVFCLKFDTLRQTWALSSDAGETWKQNVAMHLVASNSLGLVLNFSTNTRWQQTVIVDCQSIEKEKLLQLRRCTMCPEILKPIDS